MTWAAWAVGWTQSGEAWTSNDKVEITIPPALKVTTTETGTLNAENVNRAGSAESVDGL